MSAASDFLENKIIDHMLRNQAYTVPTALYLALFTSATTDAGGGTEVTGGSYVRKAIVLTAASGGAAENTADISYTNMPSCTVTHWAIYDASTSGNMLIHKAMVASKTYAAGETARVAAGALDVSVA